MTTDLYYLTLLAGLSLVLWIPHVLAIVTTHGFPGPKEYREGKSGELPDCGQRAMRVHINNLENLAPFVALVIVAHLTKTANETTALCAMLYFWIRVAYAIVYYLGIPYIRTVVFTAGFVVSAIIFFQIVA
jgi:uncharacterized MAPEG superfamily protein